MGRACPHGVTLWRGSQVSGGAHILTPGSPSGAALDACSLQTLYLEYQCGIFKDL